MPDSDASAEAHAKTIATFAGPLLGAIGVSMLFNRSEMAILAGQLSDDYGLIFTSGALLLIAGIAILRIHNDWSSDWRVSITAIGWIAVIGGLVRILFFRQLADVASTVAQLPGLLPVSALLLLALGAFLSLKAFR